MSAEQEPERVTEEWTFVGRYERKEGTLGVQWLDGNGEARFFGIRGSSSYVVGGRYEVSCARDGDRLTMYGDPKYVGPSDNPLRDKWRLDDRASYLAVEGRRAHKRAVKDNGDFGELTLNEVQNRMRRVGNAGQRGALLVAVLSYIEN